MWYDTDKVVVIWKTKQFQQYGKVERWLEDIWMWMLRFKDAVFGIAVEVISFWFLIHCCCHYCLGTIAHLCLVLLSFTIFWNCYFLEVRILLWNILINYVQLIESCNYFIFEIQSKFSKEVSGFGAFISRFHLFDSFLEKKIVVILC